MENLWLKKTYFRAFILLLICSNVSAQDPTESPKIVVNQLGYRPELVKTASIICLGESVLNWTLEDASTGQVVLAGQTSPASFDPLSGDTIHPVDFSSVFKSGMYRLRTSGADSYVFRIEKSIYARLAQDSLSFFYLNRSGIPLLEEYAGTTWARQAGHESDSKVPVYNNADITINGYGGWYDAGDFGKYVVNGGIAVWTLQNAWERRPKTFRDGSQFIPENNNKIPDILDEARWELEFMLRMQVPKDQALAGMVYHKLHDLKWSSVPARLPALFLGERYVYEPSTAATLNLAACAAQAARLWKSFDLAFSDRCVRAAREAWAAALLNPALLAGNVPGSGGGNYDDNEVGDEFFWAAAELYATTQEAEFLNYLKKSPGWTTFPGDSIADGNSMHWGKTGALGTISLLTSPLAKADKEILQKQVLSAADRYLNMTKLGYRLPMDRLGYVWGSNSGLLNNALILALAYDISLKKQYLEGVVHAMDYLLGHNGLGKSYISGYGSDSMKSPHHRVWGNAPSLGYPPPPPGALAGGPNAKLQDPAMGKANLDEVPMAKRYLDSIESYATNEVAINWNAPLVWVCSWLDSQ